MKERLSVLICDDTHENIETLISVLDSDYELFIANTAEAALEIIRVSKVDIVLLDILMPGMDGYELCKIIKSYKQYKETPVIFISGMADNHDKQKGFSVGAVDYITKPFNVAEVKARVNAQADIVKYTYKQEKKNQFLERTVQSKDYELRVAYNRLELAYLETIEKLSTAAEYKDDVTGLHVRRVGLISKGIAKEIGLDEYFVKAIEHAAPLHDIGKIGIPEAILLKPGKLDEFEWKIMKTHTEIGRDILKGSSSDIVNMAETIAYTHHEKWDGSGYPLGLYGDEIPIESRIVAIADVYDAVTSKRSYKEAFTKEKALSIITEGSGSHFDPIIVEAFIRVVTKIELEIGPLR